MKAIAVAELKNVHDRITFKDALWQVACGVYVENLEKKHNLRFKNTERAVRQWYSTFPMSHQFRIEVLRASFK